MTTKPHIGICCNKIDLDNLWENLLHVSVSIFVTVQHIFFIQCIFFHCRFLVELAIPAAFVLANTLAPITQQQPSGLPSWRWLSHVWWLLSPSYYSPARARFFPWLSLKIRKSLTSVIGRFRNHYERRSTITRKVCGITKSITSSRRGIRESMKYIYYFVVALANIWFNFSVQS